MFAWFGGLPVAVQAAVVTGTLAMITGITVALIQKGRKKKMQTGTVTVTQTGSTYTGKGAGAVAGGNQDFSEHSQRG